VARISSDKDVVTLINTFTVEPDNQQRLVEVLVEGIQTTINTLPGFISANIHKSLDGTRVVNYAQWESRETLEAVFGNPEAMSHMREAGEVAENSEPYLYEVSFVDEATPS
jgi:quinol monooxygenase YgiN